MARLHICRNTGRALTHNSNIFTVFYTSTPTLTQTFVLIKALSLAQIPIFAPVEGLPGI